MKGVKGNERNKKEMTIIIFYIENKMDGIKYSQHNL